MRNPFTQNRWIILVADRDEQLVSTVCTSLSADYDTLQAHSGKEALDMYKQFRPDMIVIETDMGGMGGFEVCEKIKEIAGKRFTPLIFISQNSDIESIKKGLQSGAEDYLAKPFEYEELYVRIQATLRTKKLYTHLMKAYEVIDSERSVIANIQQSLLCEKAPEIPGFNFFTRYQPSSKAGGDYFDFFKIEGDKLGVLVSDVSGHGTPAAVIMAMKRVLLHSFLAKSPSPKEVLERLNGILCDNLKSGQFITAFYGVIDLHSRKMRYVSAGHNPPILADLNEGRGVELWADRGFPLMIFPKNYMEEHEVQLPRNGKLVLYTDGLTEARNPDGEAYGSERLMEGVLRLGKQGDANALGTALLREVENFIEPVPFHDDYTMVIVDIE